MSSTHPLILTVEVEDRQNPGQMKKKLYHKPCNQEMKVVPEMFGFRSAEDDQIASTYSGIICTKCRALFQNEDDMPFRIESCGQKENSGG
jgi:hypothetical protein